MRSITVAGNTREHTKRCVGSSSPGWSARTRSPVVVPRHASQLSHQCAASWPRPARILAAALPPLRRWHDAVGRSLSGRHFCKFMLHNNRCVRSLSVLREKKGNRVFVSFRCSPAHASDLYRLRPLPCCQIVTTSDRYRVARSLPPQTVIRSLQHIWWGWGTNGRWHKHNYSYISGVTCRGVTLFL